MPEHRRHSSQYHSRQKKVRLIELKLPHSFLEKNEKNYEIFVISGIRASKILRMPRTSLLAKLLLALMHVYLLLLNGADTGILNIWGKYVYA